MVVPRLREEEIKINKTTSFLLGERKNANVNQDMDGEDDPNICGEPDIGDLDEIVEPDLISEEGSSGRPLRSRAAPKMYDPSTGRSYHIDGRKYCSAMKYGGNLVPKMHSARKNKL